MIDRELNYGRHLIDAYTREIAPYRRVVDLGAGPGIDLDIAKSNCPNAELVAIEAYPPYAEKLREKSVVVHELNIERDPLPYASGEVDLIIVNQVLEHVKEVFWIFHEITRVLPVGGSLIIGVPNLASLHNRILLAFGIQPSPIKTRSAHVRGYTKGDLLEFVNVCFPGGYELKKFGGGNFYPFPPVVAKPLARMLPNMAWGMFLLLTKKKEYDGSFLRYPVENELETNFFLGEQE